MPNSEKVDVLVAQYDTLQNQEKLENCIKQEINFTNLCNSNIKDFVLYKSKYFVENKRDNNKVLNIFKEHYLKQDKSNKALQLSFDFVLIKNKIVYLVEVKNICDLYYKQCTNYFLELPKYNSLLFWKQRFESEGIIIKIINIFFNAYTKEYTLFEIDENTTDYFETNNQLMSEYTAFEGSRKVLKDVILLNKYSDKAIRNINTYLN